MIEDEVDQLDQASGAAVVGLDSTVIVSQQLQLTGSSHSTVSLSSQGPDPTVGSGPGTVLVQRSGVEVLAGVAPKDQLRQATAYAVP